MVKRSGNDFSISGVRGGGLVEGLPVHSFRKVPDPFIPIEVRLNSGRAWELQSLGFVPLEWCKGTDDAAFSGAPSCHKPKLYDTDQANDEARRHAQLAYIMAVSRFAHYLQAIIRDRVGAFLSRADTERLLNRWLNRYVEDHYPGGEPIADPQIGEPPYPLREAHVDVVEIPGRPGMYRAVAFLRPHFPTLEELRVSLRVVVDLPQPGGGPHKPS
jgi:type VI secretion system protein ImpC